MIDILLLNYNGEKILRETFRSIFMQVGCEYKVYFFDNGSTDKSFEIAREFDCVILSREKNGSFTSAYNELHRASGNTYKLILSNDVSFKTPDDLQDLYSHLYKNSLVATAPNSQRVDLTYDLIEKPKYSSLNLLLTISFGERLANKLAPNIGDQTVLQDSCLLVNAATLEQLFDERLQFYFTEDYLCDVLRTRGEFNVNPRVEVKHLFQHGTNLRRPGWKILMYRRDAIRYFRLRHGYLAGVFFGVISLPRLLFSLLKNR